MVKLKNDFINVMSNGTPLYGGNQMHCKKKRMQGYACGAIGCANVIFYDKRKSTGNTSVDEKEYLRFVDYLSRFMWVLPKFGMNGLFMALGLNIYYAFKGEKKYALWGCRHKNVYRHIERMLQNDIPVVIAAGPNFPNLFGKKRLNLYTKSDDNYVVTTSTRAHYMTVTEIDDEWIKVSSWGNPYYIKRKEYTEYVKKKSSPLFSSILIIKDKK